MILISCEERGEVRIMPEFNYDQTTIDLSKNEGSSVTALVYTTEDKVAAQYTADWLSVDINPKRAIYIATATNETGEPRSVIVKLISGEFSIDVTVTQSDKDASEDTNLKVGQLTEDGLGMIFWVDPSDPESGKAISLERWGGNAYEANIISHGALSTVDGPGNTALFVNPGPTDAVALCTVLGEGWYLPASGELLELFAAYNGVSHTDPAFTNDVPANISGAEKAARAIFDQYLTDLGGTIINAAADTGNGESYWSSTENAAGTSARYVRFGKYAMDNGAKTGTSRFVRAMKVIGNYQFPEEPATISVSPAQVSLTGEAGATGTSAVTTNKSSYTVTIEGDGSTWLSASQEDKTITFTASSENNTEGSRAATVTVVAGSGENQATATITVTQQKVITVEPFVIGDYVTKDGETDLSEGGIVFWVDSTDPTKAKIVSLQRESLKWTTAATAVSLGVTNGSDGYANTQTIALSEHVADIPAIQYCMGKGAGWYWPARNELIALYDAYNGGHSFTAATPDLISDAEKASRAAFDQIFTAHGGVILNTMGGAENGDSYWSSTESTNGANGFYVRFGRYGDLNIGKTGSARFVRCVRSVSR
jgi:hypothetical protein